MILYAFEQKFYSVTPGIIDIDSSAFNRNYK
jgi:hypothetical protein